jgi:hypothetical protein
MAGEVMLSASTVHSPTILMHSSVRLAEPLRQRGIAVILDARLKSAPPTAAVAHICQAGSRTAVP